MYSVSTNLKITNSACNPIQSRVRDLVGSLLVEAEWSVRRSHDVGEGDVTYAGIGPCPVTVELREHFQILSTRANELKARRTLVSNHIQAIKAELEFYRQAEAALVATRTRVTGRSGEVHQKLVELFKAQDQHVKDVRAARREGFQSWQSQNVRAKSTVAGLQPQPPSPSTNTPVTQIVSILSTRASMYLPLQGPVPSPQGDGFLIEVASHTMEVSTKPPSTLVELEEAGAASTVQVPSPPRLSSPISCPFPPITSSLEKSHVELEATSNVPRHPGPVETGSGSSNFKLDHLSKRGREPEAADRESDDLRVPLVKVPRLEGPLAAATADPRTDTPSPSPAVPSHPFPGDNTNFPLSRSFQANLRQSGKNGNTAACGGQPSRGGDLLSRLGRMH